MLAPMMRDPPDPIGVCVTDIIGGGPGGVMSPATQVCG
ncbi:hypothetical protein T261_01353 [Streptomyces lydicus]|nr:hypothetical protein T261_01353 [Streptomyces lydicus]